MTQTETQQANLDEIRQLLLSMAEKGQVVEAVDLLVELVRAVRDRNTELELRLRTLLKDKFGRKSETLAKDQLDLFLGLLGVPVPPEAPSDASEAEGADAAEPEDEPKKRARPHGRRPLPEHLPREEKVLPVPPEERPCPTCGLERECIGYERSEVLEFVPGHFVVEVLLREKLACRPCGEGVVVAAPANKVIERGLPGPGAMAEVLVNKYTDSLPLYRQHERFKRLGVDIARSTLGNWVAEGAWLLRPIALRLALRVLAAHVLQTDSTHLRVLDDSRKPAVKRGTLWCYVGDGQDVVFRYTPTGHQDAPLAFLALRRGWLQADGTNLYDKLFKDRPGHAATAVEVGCWMHGRRYFVRALEAGDLRAAVPLKKIQALYKIEDDANALGLDPDARLALRQEKSVPVLLELGTWIAATANREPPKSPLAKAMTYSVNQWQALMRYTEDGRLPIDNGAVERAIRTVAVGRKNYLFAGSDEGAERAAILYSILGSCALAGVDPWAYLRDVLDKLAGNWPHHRLDELLPAQWKTLYAKPVAAEPPPPI